MHSNKQLLSCWHPFITYNPLALYSCERSYKFQVITNLKKIKLIHVRFIVSLPFSMCYICCSTSIYFLENLFGFEHRSITRPSQFNAIGIKIACVFQFILKQGKKATLTPGTQTTSLKQTCPSVLPSVYLLAVNMNLHLFYMESHVVVELGGYL